MKTHEFKIDVLPCSAEGVYFPKTISVIGDDRGSIDLMFRDDVASCIGTVGSEAAKQLRDVLASLYPLPVPTFADPGKWQVIADGIDRIKVPNGWIYQNMEGQMLFVPEQK